MPHGSAGGAYDPPSIISGNPVGAETSRRNARLAIAAPSRVSTDIDAVRSRPRASSDKDGLVGNGKSGRVAVYELVVGTFSPHSVG